jgi:hypothetical protein
VTQTLAAIVIVALAAYRLAGVIALDTISEPFRVWVYGKGHHEVPPFALEADPIEVEYPVISAEVIYGSSITIPGVEERKAGTAATAWHWFYGLISCPFCCGWWLSLAGWWAYTGEFFTSRAWAIQAIAVAGVQSAIPSNRAS